jgi:hypothetical protein
MHRQLTSCLLVALVTVPICAWAEPGPPSAAASGSEAGATLRLSLKEAVDIALSPAGNARLQLAEELTQQARARSAQSRAALLPNIDAAVLQQSQTRNLAALGVRIQLPIPLLSGHSMYSMRAYRQVRAFSTSVRSGDIRPRAPASARPRQKSRVPRTRPGIWSRAPTSPACVPRPASRREKPTWNFRRPCSGLQPPIRRPEPAQGSKSHGHASSWPTSVSSCWSRRMN